MLVAVETKKTAHSNDNIPVFFSTLRNSHRFGKIYSSSGKLFLELNQFKDQFRKWVAPAFVDLDTVFEREMTEPQDWDSALQAAKKKKEELAGLFR